MIVTDEFGVVNGGTRAWERGRPARTRPRAPSFAQMFLEAEEVSHLHRTRQGRAQPMPDDLR
jgi:hypothetical protein